MSRNQNFTGVIIRKRTIQEDLCVTILCNNGRRLDLTAKGAANGRSRRRSHLELMNLLSGTFYEGRTRMYLQDAVCQKSFHHMKDDLELSMRMYLLLEIIEHTVLEDDPYPEIFTLLLGTLESFNKKDPNPLTLEITLTKLAHQLGYLPDFKECSNCHKSITEDDALWNRKKGTLLCQNCPQDDEDINEHFPLKYRKALEFFKRSHSSDLDKIVIAKEEHDVIKEFLPNLFALHIERPLKSLAVL